MYLVVNKVVSVGVSERMYEWEVRSKDVGHLGFKVHAKALPSMR